MRSETTQQPTQPVPSTDPTPFDAFVSRLIRRKSRQLVGRAGFTRSDRPDIEQELARKLLAQMALFDAEQGHWYVFVTTVVERHAANILRNKRAEKRDHRRETSLNTIVDRDDNGPVFLGDLIGQREYDARCHRCTRDEAEQTELAADLANVLATLSDDVRDLAERLMYASASEIARETAVPRSTLQRRMERIRRAFEDAGLRNYL